MKTGEQKRLDWRAFVVSMLVCGFAYPILDAFLHGKSLAEGLWVSFKILPAIGIMMFIVALVFDKSVLFDDERTPISN